MRKRLGDILLERRVITEDQLAVALAHQHQWGMRLGTALVSKGFLSEGLLVQVLSESLSIPMVDLAKVAPEAVALQLVSAQTCEQHEVFPIAVREQRGKRLLLLAMADPLNVTVIDEIAFVIDATIKPAIAPRSAIEASIRRSYYGHPIDIPPLDVATQVPLSSAPPPSSSSAASKTVPGGRAASYERTQVDFTIDDVSDPGGSPIMVLDDYAGMPTGVFALTTPSTPSTPSLSPPHATGEYNPIRVADAQGNIDQLELKFWALMRVLTRRGLVTKDEFFAELQATMEGR
jgi:hypothetical protein